MRSGDEMGILYICESVIFEYFNGAILYSPPSYICANVLRS